MKTKLNIARKAGLPLVAAITGFVPAGAIAQRYEVIDLGTLSGPTAGAFAVNDFGRVAGTSTRSDANSHAFVWDGGLTEIMPLPGDHQAHAFAIDAAGTIVSTSYDLGELTVRGFAYHNGAVTSLGNFAPRGTNGSGAIVGNVSLTDSSFGWVDHAARWNAGVLSDLGTLGGHFSYAYDIAADGRIVGMSFTAGDADRRATMWVNGAIRDLGTLGGASSHAYAINDSGIVVGCSDSIGGVIHAFRYETNTSGTVTSRTDLGSLSGRTSFAYDVNNRGDIVGTSAARAVMWTSGAIVDLNAVIPASAGWKLEAAWAINNVGEIVGMGQHFGYPHAYLLTPSDCPDLDGNGVVDLVDLATLLAHFGTGSAATFEDGDIDTDGDVDLTDLATLLSYFGSNC